MWFFAATFAEFACRRQSFTNFVQKNAEKAKKTNINRHLWSRADGCSTLLKSQKKWRSVSELLDHFLDYTQPEECNGLVTYLRSIAQVGHIPSHDLDALDHATCHGFIAWANLAMNKPHFATMSIPARHDPVSLLIDQHPGDNYFLSWRWGTPLPPPVVQPGGRAVV